MKVSNKDINLLTQALKENDLSFIEYSDAEFSIKLGTGVPAPSNVGNSHFLPNEQSSGKGSVDNSSQAPAGNSNLTPIKVPIVGNIFLAKSPTAKPFVTVGQSINVGDVICIVEAMKVMNEIKADKAGIVENICVEDGTFVDANTTIMELK